MLTFFEQTAPVFNVHESMRKAKKSKAFLEPLTSGGPPTAINEAPPPTGP